MEVENSCPSKLSTLGGQENEKSISNMKMWIGVATVAVAILCVASAIVAYVTCASVINSVAIAVLVITAVLTTVGCIALLILPTDKKSQQPLQSPSTHSSSTEDLLRNLKNNLPPVEMSKKLPDCPPSQEENSSEIPESATPSLHEYKTVSSNTLELLKRFAQEVYPCKKDQSGIAGITNDLKSLSEDDITAFFESQFTGSAEGNTPVHCLMLLVNTATSKAFVDAIVACGENSAIYGCFFKAFLTARNNHGLTPMASLCGHCRNLDFFKCMMRNATALIKNGIVTSECVVDCMAWNYVEEIVAISSHVRETIFSILASRYYCYKLDEDEDAASFLDGIYAEILNFMDALGTPSNLDQFLSEKQGFLSCDPSVVKNALIFAERNENNGKKIAEILGKIATLENLPRTCSVIFRAAFGDAPTFKPKNYRLPVPYQPHRSFFNNFIEKFIAAVDKKSEKEIMQIFAEKFHGETIHECVKMGVTTAPWTELIAAVNKCGQESIIYKHFFLEFIRQKDPWWEGKILHGLNIDMFGDVLLALKIMAKSDPPKSEIASLMFDCNETSFLSIYMHHQFPTDPNRVKKLETLLDFAGEILSADQLENLLFTYKSNFNMPFNYNGKFLNSTAFYMLHYKGGIQLKNKILSLIEKTSEPHKTRMANAMKNLSST
ncbi:MAG: hypothetical protein LBI69_02615 [Puniceicoccales bacterium]|nr:hypothetical protein [Puniceicoccales bacterium]